MLRTSLSRVLALTCLAFSLSFSVAVLEPAVLGHKILQLAGHSRNAALGLITFAGLMMAASRSPSSARGRIAHRRASAAGFRFWSPGRRVSSFVCMPSRSRPPSRRSHLSYRICFFQFGSGTAQAPWQAVFQNEHIPAQQRGVRLRHSRRVRGCRRTCGAAGGGTSDRARAVDWRKRRGRHGLARRARSRHGRRHDRRRQHSEQRTRRSP